MKSVQAPLGGRDPQLFFLYGIQEGIYTGKQKEKQIGSGAEASDRICTEKPKGDEEMGTIGIGTGLLDRPEYAFLRENEHLGKQIILLGIGGSISYGTNIDDSDIDLRGIALNRKEELIGLQSFDQYVDTDTDSVIYSLGKIIPLLMSCNPNTIELLGLRPEHYLYVSECGKLLLENRKLFLSRKAIQSFGGYADAQLRRMQNALARDTYPQTEKEKHIFHSVKNAMFDFNSRFQNMEDGGLRIYIDQAVHPELETEIFVDGDLRHYPLRDYKGMWSVMANVVKDYEKIGKRNRKKDEKHLNKHAMHLIRLFMMAIDILEKEEIMTYREQEQKLLMDIRMGKFMKENGCFDEAFYDLLNEYEKKLAYAAEHTALGEGPDTGRIQEMVMYMNEKVIRDEL